MSEAHFASIQKDMIGYYNLVRPAFAPLLAIETMDDRRILVLCILGSDERPHEVPESITARRKVWKHDIRRYASTIETKGTGRDDHDRYRDFRTCGDLGIAALSETNRG